METRRKQRGRESKHKKHCYVLLYTGKHLRLNCELKMAWKEVVVA
jgi:hypothetical protein